MLSFLARLGSWVALVIINIYFLTCLAINFDAHFHDVSHKQDECKGLL
jgi:hypothetical protein